MCCPRGSISCCCGWRGRTLITPSLYCMVHKRVPLTPREYADYSTGQNPFKNYININKIQIQNKSWRKKPRKIAGIFFLGKEMARIFDVCLNFSKKSGQKHMITDSKCSKPDANHVFHTSYKFRNQRGEKETHSSRKTERPVFCVWQGFLHGVSFFSLKKVEPCHLFPLFYSPHKTGNDTLLWEKGGTRVFNLFNGC